MKQIVLGLLCVLGLQAQSTVHYYSTGNAYPVYQKYAVVKTSGNWLVNGGNSQAAAAATSQAINLFTLSANWYVIGPPFIKTSTACAGLTAITITDVGITGTAGYFSTGLTYNLKTAVSVTNFAATVLANILPSTTASTTATVTISGTLENISSITDGCAFDVTLLWGVRP